MVENEFGVFHNGENAHIGLKLRNHGNDMTENFTMSLSCESPYIEITQGTHQHQNLAPNQAITLNDVFRFNIADDMDDAKITETLTGFATEIKKQMLPVGAPFARQAADEAGVDKEGVTDIVKGILRK